MRKDASRLSSISLGVLAILFSGVAVNVNGQPASDCNQTLNHEHIVQPGEALYQIGIDYGDIRFWEAIYIANADRINNPDLIYPGQPLKIPQKIFSFEGSGQPVMVILESPFCDGKTLPVAAVDMSRLSLYDSSFFEKNSDSRPDSILANNAADPDLLDEFRQAFSSVVDEEQENGDTLNTAANEVSGRDKIQQQSERQIMMEIDGMVLDETRSKVGRDFYDVFYTSWQPRPDTHNFSIRISEQPNPSLGTIIYVEVNDRETFRMRLQPRYDFIQQAGRYAVRQTYSYLQNNDHRLQIY